MLSFNTSGKQVLVVGDANVDLIVDFPRMLPSGAMQYPNPEMQGGGTAANTAVALAKLGVPTRFMGTVGQDSYGRHVIKEMEQEGIDISPLVVEPELNTVCVFAFVDEVGERYLWGWPREKQSFKYLDPGKIQWDAVKDACWVHSSGMVLTYDETARHSVVEIFKTAYQLGIPTSFDLNLRVENDQLDPSYKQAVLSILPYCQYVLGSGQEEIYYLSGNDRWEETARQLATGDHVVIARMGSGGSMAFYEQGVLTKPAFPVCVSDTVGAGDVYNAGFIAARLAGLSLEESLGWGNGVGGYKVERKGPRSTPDQIQLNTFIEHYTNTP